MNVFDLDQARLGAATGLSPEHFDEFQRLSKTLIHGPAFQFVLVECTDERLRGRVLASLDEVLRAAGLSVSALMLDRTIESPADIEVRLVRQASEHDVVHVLGVSWFTSSRWEDFNTRRDRLALAARARLVFWLAPEALKLLTLHAPDLWAWRAGVYAFEAPTGAAEPAHFPAPHPFEGRRTGIDPRGKVERHRRIAELRTALDGGQEIDDELRAALLDELAELHALRGDLDEALRIREEEELPVYERLGDVRSKAVTQGQIADILLARGRSDEALRILEEVLTAFEQTGDVHSKAITQGRIADILQAQGRLDEALRIRKEEELPVYEQLGDVRSKAITQGQIADILQTRGRLDEALRILEEEVLTVLDRLGDLRLKAVAQGKIADILEARGRLDEALRIREQEELPVYERLGDVRSKAICTTNIAITLHARNAPGDRAEAERLLAAALADATRLGLAETEVIGQWLTRVQSQPDR